MSPQERQCVMGNIWETNGFWSTLLFSDKPKGASPNIPCLRTKDYSNYFRYGRYGSKSLRYPDPCSERKNFWWNVHTNQIKIYEWCSSTGWNLPNHSIHFFWVSRSFEVNQSWDPTQEVSFSHQNPSKNLRSYPHGITLHSFRSRRLLDSSKKPLRCSDVPVLMGNCRKQKRFPSQLPSSGRAINIHLAGLRMKTWDVDTVKTPKIRPFNGESEVLNPTRSWCLWRWDRQEILPANTNWGRMDEKHCFWWNHGELMDADWKMKILPDHSLFVSNV